MKKTILLFIFALFYSSPTTAGEYTEPNIVCRKGLQVNTATGNLLHVRDDMDIPAKGNDLFVRFSYNSGETKYDYGYGAGWTHSFNIVYETIGADISVKRWDGNRQLFTFTGAVYAAPVGCFDLLTQFEPGKFRLLTKHGLEYYFDDPTHKKVSRIRDRNGNELAITYSGGYPTLITDANGRSLILQWSGGRMRRIEDFASPARSVSYHYNASGNLIDVTDQAGNSVRYAYDDYKRLVRFTDRIGTSFDITYNDDGAVVRMQSPLSDETFSYDNILTQTTHSIGGRLTTYAFDSLKRVTDISGICCGHHRQFQYDSLNNITAMTDADGNIWGYTFDSRGNKLSETNPLGYTVSFTYDPVFDHLTSFTDQSGSTTSLLYDLKGNCTNINRPGGSNSAWTYNSYGEMTSHTDPLGNVTLFTYDANSYLTGISRPIGTESFTYNEVGGMTSSTDADGNTTQYGYDILNRPVSTRNALSEVTSYAYNPAGNIVTIEYPDGNVVNFTNDALGRVTEITDGMGIVMSNSYDLAGNLDASTDASGITTDYFYDDKNFVTSMTRNGVTLSYTYDPNGNVKTFVDGEGIVATYAYDAMNRNISASKGGVTTYTTYGPRGNVGSLKDGMGNITSHVYDVRNNLVRVMFPDGSSNRYAYDLNNNRTSRTDRNGDAILYEYDANNYLTKRDYPGSNDDVFTYSAGGQLLSATNSNASITFAYDAAHNMLSETMNGKTTSYTPNTPARQYTVGYPGGSVAQETRDLRGSLISLNKDGMNINFVRDPGNRLTAINYGDNISTSYGYNSKNLVSEITHTIDGNIVAGFNYAYDDAGNCTGMADLFDSVRTESYGYNSMGWLNSYVRGTLTGSGIPLPAGAAIFAVDSSQYTLTVHAINGIVMKIPNHSSYDSGAVVQLFPTANVGYHFINWTGDLSGSANPASVVMDGNKTIVANFGLPTDSTIYNFDNAGNWTSVRDGGTTTTYTTNNLNQYTSCSPGGAFSYDLNGNLIASRNFGGEYDYGNHLIHAVDSVTHNEGFYKYDALQRRIQKLTTTDTINYYYAGFKVIEERSSGNAVLKTYLYGDEGIEDVIGMTREGTTYFYAKNAEGSVVAITSAGMLKNAQGPVAAMARSSAAVVERCTYNAYGALTVWDPAYSATRTTSLVGNSRFHTGKEYDAEAGAYSSRENNYNPYFGRNFQSSYTGEPVPGAEIFVEQEPEDEPQYGANPEDGEPVPGAEIFVEQDPEDEPIASSPTGPTGGGSVKIRDQLKNLFVQYSDGGPYSQSLSNLEDNGVVDQGSGSGGGGSRPPNGGNPIRSNASGGYPVDFVGASVGDPAVFDDGGSVRTKTSFRGAVYKLNVKAEAKSKKRPLKKK